MNPDETDMAAEPDKDLSVDELEGVAGGRGATPTVPARPVPTTGLPMPIYEAPRRFPSEDDLPGLRPARPRRLTDHA